jgi:hypothetical protein
MVLVAGLDSRACSELSRTDGVLGGGKLRRELLTLTCLHHEIMQKPRNKRNRCQQPSKVRDKKIKLPLQGLHHKKIKTHQTTWKTLLR